jgi:hypothetical protein
MSNRTPLQGTVALVSGANRGIGALVFSGTTGWYMENSHE